jgi:glycosyltransferase involved in cell wall biosynthesis
LQAIDRLAFIGNSLPRRCGIATFTTELQRAVARLPAGIETRIVAMTDHDQDYAYPPAVGFQVQDQQRRDYARAADWLNAGHFQAVSLQHEFGIFGGDAGSYLLEMLPRLAMPLVTTLHTILQEPRPAQRAVMNGIIAASSILVVMAEKARDMLQTIYRVPARKIEVIAHGTPDYPLLEPDAAKARLGFAGRPVILTFGLLSPSKGIEVVIDAMPTILERSPEALYVVLGATHPNLVRDQGEIYRERLVARARERGVADHVVFLDRFVDQATLVEFISMCDVYVTPYLNAAQMTSGTLAYSFALGKAVVSTPYWHAQELLADGRGILVPFGDATAIGAAVAGVLTDDTRRQALRESAYAYSRPMTWEHTAEHYLATAERARQLYAVRTPSRRSEVAPAPDSLILPPMRLGHLLSMCDDTGLLQHAACSVPDRAHGYCIDDNARALLLACSLEPSDRYHLPEIVVSRLTAFIQHAWNPELRRFRNFMSFDRRWLEPRGSEDSHGRTLWALGECTRRDLSQLRRVWARGLFRAALPVVEAFTSPRAWAFALLGLDGYCDAEPLDAGAAQLRSLLAQRLMTSLEAARGADWTWFEDGLSYDNARLPQALIVTGTTSGEHDLVTAGLATLRWLMDLQTTADGSFRPVGSDSFGDRRMKPRRFDQQPLEATAAVAACLAAARIDEDARWTADAEMAFAWFLGRNDLSALLVDLQTGGCRDGLHADRANENRGGESVVSYLLALADIQRLSTARGQVAGEPRLVALSA